MAGAVTLLTIKEAVGAPGKAWSFLLGASPSHVLARTACSLPALHGVTQCGGAWEGKPVSHSESELC